MREFSIDVLIAMGYRRISRAYGIVARIDRADWLEFMKANRHGGHGDIEPLLKYSRLPEEQTPKDIVWVIRGLEDSYRRGLSKDVLTLPQSAALKIPRSGLDRTGYQLTESPDGQ